jgi:hypothetical protein
MPQMGLEQNHYNITIGLTRYNVSLMGYIETKAEKTPIVVQAA